MGQRSVGKETKSSRKTNGHKLNGQYLGPEILNALQSVNVRVESIDSRSSLTHGLVEDMKKKLEATTEKMDFILVHMEQGGMTAAAMRKRNGNRG